MIFYWIILGLVFLAIIIQDISDTLSPQIDKIHETFKIETSTESIAQYDDEERTGERKENSGIQGEQIKTNNYGSMNEGTNKDNVL